MQLNLILYILKCITGCTIVFVLSWLLNYPDISWFLISVILVITPDSAEAVPLAMTRIKANFIGGIASVLCLLVFAPTAFSISLAIVLSIIGCYYFKLMTGSRAAIAAVIIIMMHGIEYDQPFFWSATLKRLMAVIVGCLIGLLVTVAFHRNIVKTGKKGMDGEN